MAKRLYDKGSLFGVSIGVDEISEFRDRWPASGLGGLRNLYAEFEKRSGDLVDLEANGRSGAGRFDGAALAALTDDMQCWAEASLGIDTGRGCSSKTDWREYLGPPRKTKTTKSAHATRQSGTLSSAHHVKKKSSELCVDVAFRVFPEGDVIALFPGENAGHGMINSYQHVGQHSGADQALLKKLRKATPAEYASLLAELKRIGYCLRVRA